MFTVRKRIAGYIALICLVLVIPVIAMVYTAEVKWGLMDFLVAAFLVSATCIGAEILVRKVKNKGWRIALVGLVIAVLIITWAELAVGLFGTPFAGS